MEALQKDELVETEFAQSHLKEPKVSIDIAGRVSGEKGIYVWAFCSQENVMK